MKNTMKTIKQQCDQAGITWIPTTGKTAEQLLKRRYKMLSAIKLIMDNKNDL